MCLAVPVKLIRIIDAERGIIESGGVRKEVNLSLIDSPSADDYVLVHAGFAIGKMDRVEAEETLEIFREIMEAEE